MICYADIYRCREDAGGSGRKPYLRRKCWRARQDSNLRPTDSKPASASRNSLSILSFTAGATRPSHAAVPREVKGWSKRRRSQAVTDKSTRSRIKSVARFLDSRARTQGSRSAPDQ